VYAVVFSWIWSPICGPLVLLAGPSLLFPALYILRGRQGHRACKEMAKLVSENLLDASDGKVWVVHFHTSDLPGRGREYSERFLLSTRERTVTGDDRDTGNQHITPIFLKQRVSADIEIWMKYDASWMTVGTMTCRRLRSLHESMTDNIWMTGSCCFFLFPYWVSAFVFALKWEWLYGLFVLLAGPVLMKMVDLTRQYHTTRACKETARLLTESLPESKDGVDWVVEYDTLEVPGRGLGVSARYVFSKKKDEEMNGVDHHAGDEDFVPILPKPFKPGDVHIGTKHDASSMKNCVLFLVLLICWLCLVLYSWKYGRDIGLSAVLLNPCLLFPAFSRLVDLSLLFPAFRGLRDPFVWFQRPETEILRLVRMTENFDGEVETGFFYIVWLVGSTTRTEGFCRTPMECASTPSLIRLWCHRIVRFVPGYESSVRFLRRLRGCS